MTTEVIGVIVTILAVIGVVLNNRKMIGCFYFWIASNFLSGVIHYQTAVWSMCIRDLVFILLALDGIWRWRKKTAK